MESSGPFYDYPVLAVTAKMGKNKTAPNEEYPNLEGTVMYSSASIARGGNIKTAPNEAYEFITKEEDRETAPYKTYMKKQDIEMAPNEAYGSGRGFRDRPKVAMTYPLFYNHAVKSVQKFH